MKKLSRLAVVSAIALAAIGCAKESISVPDSPLYNPDTKEVTTQFVLNVATTTQTKQSAATVQQANNFRGINGTHIFVYQSGIASGTPYVKPGTATSPKEFELGILYRSGDIVPANNQASDSRRTLQLSIPVNTDAVLFYGKAINESQGAETGKSIATYKTDPTETEIAVVKRMGETTEKYDATAHLMVFVVNKIISTSVTELVVDESNKSQYNDITGTYPACSWNELASQYEYANNLYDNRFSLDPSKKRTLTPLEEILGRVYSQFTHLNSGEYRAGCSHAVNWMMQDMYAVVQSVIDATPTNIGESNAERLAKAIATEMGKYFTISESTFAYKANDAIKTALGDSWDAEFENALGLDGYPYADFGIPEGAAQLGFTDSTGKFYYLHPNNALVQELGGAKTFEPRKYVYPAELFYYANSAIRTSSDGALTDASFPDGTDPWNSSTLWNSWTTPGKVQSSTRGVAVKDNINYGVALLKTAVSLNGSTFYDNRKEMTGNEEENQTFTSLDLSLKGILVGGVTPRLNWQFLRKYLGTYNATSNPYAIADGVIYDDKIVYAGVPTKVGSENYTLVYDNYDPTITVGQDQPGVYIALEFINNGDAFWGKHNLIRKGATFYLVGKLEPANATNKSTLAWPTDHQIPPLYGIKYGSYDGTTIPAGKEAGQSMQIPRVFIQDFMTTATFRIGQESLQKAYYSLPDLRSSQMSLGLSVDLKWETGLDFVTDL